MQKKVSFLVSLLALTLLIPLNAKAQIFFPDNDAIESVKVFPDNAGNLFTDEERTKPFKVEVKCNDPQNNLNGTFKFDLDDPSGTVEMVGTIDINCNGTGGTVASKAIKITEDGLFALEFSENNQIVIETTLKLAAGQDDPGFQIPKLAIDICFPEEVVGPPEPPEPPEPPPEPPETNCKGDFTSNGMQPVAGVFQDDDTFKKHTQVIGPIIQDFDGTIKYGLTLNEPKELINNRLTLAMARDPNYDSLEDLTKLTFTGNSEFTKIVPAKLNIIVTDPSGEKLNYTHSMTVKGPFAPPCGETQPFSITYDLKKLLKKKPKPQPFLFGATGAGKIIATVNQGLMTVETSFNIADTSTGKIGVVPVGNPTAPNVFAIKRKFSKDAAAIAKALSTNLPDIFPLPSVKVDVVNLPFVTFKPKDEGDTEAKKIENNLNEADRILNLNRELFVKQQGIDLLIAVLDTDLFAKVDDGDAAAFAYVGSPADTGLVYVKGTNLRGKIATVLQQRVEDAIHEIAHSYGFVGDEDTTCPPDIHNENITPADNCRITNKLKVKNSCALNKEHIMGPTVPSALVTQCTFEAMTDIFKTVAATKKKRVLNRSLLETSADETSTLLQFKINRDGSEASFFSAYDSANTAAEFLQEAPGLFHLDLRDGTNNSIDKLFFDLDTENLVLESDVENMIVDLTIPRSDDLRKVVLLNAQGQELAEITISENSPTVEIVNAELKKGNAKKGSELNLSWNATDPNESPILSTVLLGTDADSLAVFGGAFEVTETSINLVEIPKDIKFVQVLVTNGSRSASSEVIEL